MFNVYSSEEKISQLEDIPNFQEGKLGIFPSIIKTTITDGDIIVITFDLNKISIDDVAIIIQQYQQIFPNNKIVPKLFPLVKSIDIIHPEEKEF